MSLFQKILRQLDEAKGRGAVDWRDVESVLVTLNKKFHALNKNIHSELGVSFARDPRKTTFAPSRPRGQRHG